MARNYRISVNGKSYDVVVEEAGGAAAPVVAPVAAPAPAPVAAAPAPAPVPAAPAPAPVAAGAGSVTAPMPGKILKLHVKQGDSVTNGQLVLILEAMKMENESFATAAGTVTQLSCKEGDSVNTGDTLLVIG